MAMAAAKGPGNTMMPDKVLVFYGSYRTTRVGIRMASFVVNELRARGAFPELIDAREIGLPILDRMYKEYPPLLRRWKILPEKFARQTLLCSLWVNIIGGRSQG